MFSLRVVYLIGVIYATVRFGRVSARWVGRCGVFLVGGCILLTRAEWK